MSPVRSTKNAKSAVEGQMPPTAFSIATLTAQFENEFDRLLENRGQCTGLQHAHCVGVPSLRPEAASLLSNRSNVRLTIATNDGDITPDELTPTERLQYDNFPNDHRRACWLRGRSALKQLLRRCGKSEDTSILKFPEQRFSLSHSGDMAIAAHAQLVTEGVPAHYEIVGTGIDLEIPREVSPKSMRFFLQAGELALLAQDDCAGNNDNLLRLWTVKEALFKADLENFGRFPGQYETITPLAHSGWGRHREAAPVEFVYCSKSTVYGTISVALALRSSGGEFNHD